MSEDNFARNLVAGMVANQLGFVTGTQLANAVGQLLEDPNQRIESLFGDANHLDEEDCQALSDIVNRRIARDGNDASRCLSSIPNADSILRHLDGNSGGSLQSVMPSVFKTNGKNADLDVTNEFDAANTRLLQERFQVVRPHAKGGLGEVFVANDLQLNREVALKRIQDWHADSEESRLRFNLEAEITGGLEHPGIVPVYGVGNDEDGRPFYAMRFIQGTNLKKAIKGYHKNRNPFDRERVVELRRLLANFVDVCNAIGYAHNRGILHRDIKPGNVILGRFGETLVVDWGLAKVIGTSSPNDDALEKTLLPSSGSSASNTMAGSAMGTPGFMSPEQAAGRLDQLDARSDTFSLGATLYSMLTGKPPYRREDSTDWVGQIERGEFTPPEQLQPKMPKPLASICKKSLSPAKSNRYQTPAELAEDIERWLADEPVVAHRDSSMERFNRVYRRHRTAFLVGSALLAISTVGLLGAAGIIIKKNADLVESNRLVTAEAEKTRVASDNATSTSYELLMASDSLLSRIPGEMTKRKQLTEKAIGSFRDLIESNPKNLQAKKYLAQSLLVHGNMLRFSQYKDMAEKSLAESVDIYDELASEADSPEVQSNLIGALIYYAQYWRLHGDIKKARETIDRADAIVEKVVDKGSPEFQRGLARFKDEFACILFEEQDLEKAEKLQAEATVTFRSLRELDENPQEDSFLADSLLHEGQILLAIKKDEEAYASFEQVEALATEMLSKANSRDNRNYLALAKLELGKMNHPTSPTASMTRLQDALQIWEALFEEFPSYFPYFGYSLRTKNAIADRLLQEEKADAAEELIQSVQSRVSEILEMAPSSKTFQRLMIDSLEVQQAVQRSRGEQEAANATLNGAIELQMKVLSNLSGSKKEENRLIELQRKLD